MTARNVIPFPASRIYRIPPAHQEDVRVRFAKEVERVFHAMEEEERWGRAVSVMHGSYDAPRDTEAGR